MAGFDIDSLLNFKPAKLICKKCCALMYFSYDNFVDNHYCKICNVQYITTNHYSSNSMYRYLKENGCSIEIENLIEHASELAMIARKVNKPDPNKEYPPLRALFDSLLLAQRFVHFTSYGMSHLLIGALKLISIRVPVRGIVANADDNLIKELLDYKDECPNFIVEVFPSNSNYGDFPHQKLIVIDGLMAFKGSTNLTLSGLRKAAQGKELFEIENNISEVITLNNKLFSPIWAKFNNCEVIEMLKP